MKVFQWVAKWQYWSRINDTSFSFEIKSNAKQKQTAFHQGPVLPPGGEGSPLDWKRSRFRSADANIRQLGTLDNYPFNESLRCKWRRAHFSNGCLKKLLSNSNLDLRLSVSRLVGSNSQRTTTTDAKKLCFCFHFKWFGKFSRYKLRWMI